MHSRSERIFRLFTGNERADRQSAAESLRESYNVRLHAEIFVGEKFAGASDSGLDLVEYQQYVALIAELSERFYRFRVEPIDSALALYRLGSDRADAVVNG